MQLDDLLRLVRTRWYVIAAVTGVFVLLTWALVPSRLPSAGQISYRASTTLLVTSGGGTATTAKSSNNQLATYAVVATRGQVPTAVAAQAGLSVSDLLAQVTVTPSAPTNSLVISATDRTAVVAARLADRMATELVRALGGELIAQRDAARASLTVQADDLAVQAARLAVQAGTDPGAKASLDAIDRQLTTQRARIAELDATPIAPPLRPLGPASVSRLNGAQAADKLLALPVRTLLALLIGLGSSIGVLLLADRFDVRLHTKEAVEAAFGLPVLAEVPVITRSQRRTMMVADAPETAFAEAHRMLRTSVEVAKLALGRTDEELDRPRLIVVTSADPSEGKTSTAVNLAASFAEAGRSTLLVGGDLRHSDLRQVVPGPLGGEIIRVGSASLSGRPLRVRLAGTRLEHLRCVTVEPPLGRPPVVLPELARWLVDQRDEVDTIVVDTPPLLVCNDASELIPVADAVVIVCRVGGTTADAAERCAEVLARLRARVVGAVMVGAPLRAPVRKVYGYGPVSTPRPDEPAPSVDGSPPGGQPSPEEVRAPEDGLAAPARDAAPVSGRSAVDGPTAR